MIIRAILLIFAAAVGLSAPSAFAAQVYGLRQAVETALERNFSVKAAEASRESAASQRRSSRAAFGPVLGTGYDYDRRQHGETGAGRLQDKELFTWRVYLKQNVFAGFATLAEYQKAALKEESAAAGVRMARLELIRTVQENYFLYLKAKKSVVSAEDALQRLTSQLASSKAYYDVGVSPRIDVLQAEVDVSAAESALLVAQNAVATQKARLNTLLLLPLDADVDYRTQFTPPSFTRPLEACLMQAYARRPDFFMAQKAVQIAEKDIAGAKSGFYPQVSANAAWGTSGNNALAAGSPASPTNYNEWTVGVSAEWPVFEWGRTYHDVRKAGHERNRVQAEASNLKHEIGFLVQERLLAMSEAAKRIKVARKTLEQSYEAYRMADARYRNQVGTMTDVLDAQAKLSAAEFSLTGAQADYGIALSSLYVAMGEENPSLIEAAPGATHGKKTPTAKPPKKKSSRKK